MTEDNKKLRREYFKKIEAMNNEDAKDVLKALIWNNVGRTVGIQDATHMTGGSRVYLERLCAENAVKEEKDKSRRKFNLCDCILNASIVSLR